MEVSYIGHIAQMRSPLLSPHSISFFILFFGRGGGKYYLKLIDNFNLVNSITCAALHNQ